jgi:hypothetical protein
MLVTDPLNDIITVNGRSKMAYRGRRRGSKRMVASNRGSARRSASRTPVARSASRRSIRRNVSRNGVRGNFQSGYRTRSARRAGSAGSAIQGRRVNAHPSANTNPGGSIGAKKGQHNIGILNSSHARFKGKMVQRHGFRTKREMVEYNSNHRLVMDKFGAYHSVNNAQMANTKNLKGQTLWETAGKFKGAKKNQVKTNTGK